MFCTVYFGEKENNAVPLSHSAQKKHAFLGKIKGMSEKKKLLARRKIALKLIYQRVGNKSTRSLLAEDAANVWEDIDLKNRSISYLHIMSYFFNEQKGWV